MTGTMEWNGDKVTQQLTRFLGKRVKRAGKYLEGFIKLAVSKQGSVVPFVASSPDEYPYRWGPELQDSVTYVKGETPLQAIVYSDPIDKYLNIGHHFGWEEEMGHWWNGWAYDFQTGKIVKVAPPHPVQPRPYLSRGLKEATPAILDILGANEYSPSVEV